MNYYNYFTSPIGLMVLIADESGLKKAEFRDAILSEDEIRKAEKINDLQFGNSFILDNTIHQLSEYFKKNLTVFDLPLSPEGTDFQKSVWEELQKVNYGMSRTYKSQAIALKNEKGIRAVAKANGSNPIAIIIPCHRIIGSSGELTGYAGGLWRKKWLLEHEGVLKEEQMSLF